MSSRWISISLSGGAPFGWRAATAACAAFTSELLPMPRAPQRSALLAGRPAAKRSVLSISVSRERSMPLRSGSSTRLTLGTGCRRGGSACQTKASAAERSASPGRSGREPFERGGDPLEQRRREIRVFRAMACSRSCPPGAISRRGAARQGRANCGAATVAMPMPLTIVRPTLGRTGPILEGIVTHHVGNTGLCAGHRRIGGRRPAHHAAAFRPDLRHHVFPHPAAAAAAGEAARGDAEGDPPRRHGRHQRRPDRQGDQGRRRQRTRSCRSPRA